LKDKLEDAVVDFDYQSTGYKSPDGQILNNVLVGLNAFGNAVCYKQVINADPTYTIDFEFKQITVGTNNYQAGEGTSIPIQINKTDDLSVKTTFKYILTGNLAGNTFNETSAQSVTFKWFKDIDGHEVDPILSTLTVGITPGEVINVDISPLFKDAFTGRYLGVELIAPNSTTSLVKVFD
jgi:hypothetical protein